MMTHEQIDELIEWHVRKAELFLPQTVHRKRHEETAQALRQLKRLQKTEPLRTEIIEKYNDGYEHGLRRAAEILDARMERCLSDDDSEWHELSEAKQAILNETNNQQGEGE